MGSTLSVVLVDAVTLAPLATVYTSPPLDKYSFDKYTGYSPPIAVDVKGLKVPNTNPVLVQIKFENNQRNLQVQLDHNLVAIHRLTTTNTRYNLWYDLY